MHPLVFIAFTFFFCVASSFEEPPAEPYKHTASNIEKRGNTFGHAARGFVKRGIELEKRSEEEVEVDTAVKFGGDTDENPGPSSQDVNLGSDQGTVYTSRSGDVLGYKTPGQLTRDIQLFDDVPDQESGYSGNDSPFKPGFRMPLPWYLRMIRNRPMLNLQPQGQQEGRVPPTVSRSY